jgi:hypothetical protein
MIADKTSLMWDRASLKGFLIHFTGKDYDPFPNIA